LSSDPFRHANVGCGSEVGSGIEVGSFASQLMDLGGSWVQPLHGRPGHDRLESSEA